MNKPPSQWRPRATPMVGRFALVGALSVISWVAGVSMAIGLLLVAMWRKRRL